MTNSGPLILMPTEFKLPELGENVDLSQVMIAVQKSRVSFEALTQVRNKLLTAYQDVMNMSV